MNSIPWQDKPDNCQDVMWRYTENPIINRYDIPSSNSIFNSAVVPFGDGFAGVFRCDNKAVQMNIFAGFSNNGIDWEINHNPIVMQAGNTEMIESDYKYDPRVVFIEDRYWITWCNGYHGPTIGIGYTFDFKEFFQCENAFLACEAASSISQWLTAHLFHIFPDAHRHKWRYYRSGIIKHRAHRRLGPAPHRQKWH